jgi:hypothetical protein
LGTDSLYRAHLLVSSSGDGVQEGSLSSGVSGSDAQHSPDFVVSRSSGGVIENL